MKQLNKNLPDEDVSVKISICDKCDGIVRVCVLHLMNTKTKNEFAKEVMNYDLSVKTIPLIQYREENRKWCDCKTK